jgi:hypothetical protein
MGKHVSCAVKKGFEVLKDGEICSISERDFKLFLMNWPKV